MKTLDKFEFLDTDMIKDDITKDLWEANTFLRIKDKLNEIIKTLNLLSKAK